MLYVAKFDEAVCVLHAFQKSPTGPRRAMTMSPSRATRARRGNTSPNFRFGSKEDGLLSVSGPTAPHDELIGGARLRGPSDQGDFLLVRRDAPSRGFSKRGACCNGIFELCDPLVLRGSRIDLHLRCIADEHLDVLRQLRAEGMSVLRVEHDMEFVMGLTDHLVVMEFGSKLAEGLPKEIPVNPKVLEAYLGGLDDLALEPPA